MSIKSLLVGAMLLLSPSAKAERAVTEGKASTLNSITVSSLTAKVSMGGFLTVTSSVTASTFFGDGSHITGITLPPGVTTSSLTVLGNGSDPYTSGITDGSLFKVASGSGSFGSELTIGVSTNTTRAYSWLHAGNFRDVGTGGQITLQPNSGYVTMLSTNTTKLDSLAYGSGVEIFGGVLVAQGAYFGSDDPSFNVPFSTFDPVNGGLLTPSVVSAGSVTASAFFGDGSHLSGVSGSFSGGAVANVTTFASSVTVSGAKGLLVQSSVTASAYFGDGSHLSGITTSNPIVSASSVTGGGLGTNVTISTANIVPGFNSASQLVQMNGAGAYPAASGAAITGVLASNITNGISIITGFGTQAQNLVMGGNNIIGVAAIGSPTAGGVVNLQISTSVVMVANSSITLQGANGNITSVSSITAGAFFGDGSHLSGTVAGSVAAANVTAGSFQNAGYTFPSTLVLGGALSMGSHLINNVTDPSGAQDAATKNYVDGTIITIPTKSPARAIATTALPSNVYSNGSSGIGATLTGVAIGVLTVDGVPLAVNDRVVVNGESTQANNGIYIVTTNSALVVYVLTRTTDHDTVAEMGAGVTLLVDSGTVNTDTYWAQVASVTTIGNSNSPVTFVQTNGLSSVIAGTGLTKSGNTLSITNTISNGSAGSATQVPAITYNSQGQLTAVTATSITGLAESAITGLTTDIASKLSTGTSNLVSTMTIIQDAATATAIPNTPINAVGSVNKDWQLTMQNKSNGASADSGMMWVADDGTNITKYAWCGINNSGYVGSTNGWFDGPYDATCYSQSGNFSLGAVPAGGAINIYTGGILSANVNAVFTSTGLKVYPSQFSVGTSSFSVSGGSATVGYRLTAGNISMTGSGGWLTSASSVTASAFFGDGSHLSGVTASFSGGEVTNNTTFDSSVTVNGSGGIGVSTINAIAGTQLTISTSVTVVSSATFLSSAFSVGTSTFVISGGSVTMAQGLTVRNGINASSGTFVIVNTTFTAFNGSTMSVCGPLFFISSQTVTGSTTTVGTAQTFFSTWTMPGGMFTTPGETLSIECRFQNDTTSPGTPFQWITDGAAAQTLGRGNVSTASNYVTVRTLFTYYTAGQGWFDSTVNSCAQSGGCQIQTTSEASDNEKAFDWTATTRFNCMAQKASAGNIGFMWMRVSKACQ